MSQGLSLVLLGFATLASVTAVPLLREPRTRLIELSPTQRQWMSESEFLSFRRRSRNFMDVTAHPVVEGAGPAYNATIPKELTQKAIIDPLLPQLDKAKWTETVQYFSNKFYNRYYQSEAGAESAEWLAKQYESVAGGRLDKDVHVSLFPHKFKQKSIIIRIDGTGDNAHEVVILGAQEDSVNGEDPTGRSPGADDNASGAAAALEIFRVLMANNYTGSRSVEFHSYAAEEEGELGSLDIAADYYKKGVIVASMVNFDMVGYKKPDTNGDVGLVTDDTDPVLNEYLKKIIAAYSSLGVRDTKCGYACSDFASWTKYHYPAVFPFEEVFEDHSPYIHTANDVYDTLDADHAIEFAKFGLGYVVEAAAYKGK